ncbi:TAXI family TRAP transporter solute-binding subunit [Cupriavidus basilensis]
MAGAKTAYFPYTISRGAYANQRQDVRSVATAALLLTASDLSDAEVAALTRLVFANGNDLAARGSAQGAQVSAATAQQGLAVPQHLAAAKALDAMSAGAGKK